MEEIQSWLSDNPVLTSTIGLALLALLCTLVYVIGRRWLVGGIRRLAARSEAVWDDALARNDVFLRLAHIPPVVVAYYGVQFVPDVPETIDRLIQRVAIAVMIVVTVRSLGGILSAINDIYTLDPENLQRPIWGYLRVVKIAIYLVAAVLVLATLMDRSPAIFLSGIGALTAVLLLVFRDTILSLVASVQLTSNQMIRPGDWIEMPKYGADGDVIDVALHTVKVQNWDKTITTIPTHKLIEDSFKNWRGMSDSKSRRIKRSIQIDVGSIRFLEPGEIEAFGRFSLLADYIARKREELGENNSREGIDPALSADIRNLTNVGTFRAYVLEYLKRHPKIHQSRTLIVRQLASTAQGLPLEVYCFSSDTNWANYEGIQSDIFDHLFAIAPEFGLRVFQTPSGRDLAALVESTR